jgi:hypothetical protein
MFIAEGAMGGGGGAPVGWIVFGIAVAAAVVATAVHHSRVTQARSRVGSHVQPDPGLVTLHDLPAPGSPPSMAVGVALAADTAGTVTLVEGG